MSKKVLVAMSGGVDSSVAAMLLAAQGYEVTGITMYFGISAAAGVGACCGADAIADARSICERLRIAHHVLDFSQELKKLVIDKFKKEYLRGRTPNPCVDCNRYLKFGLLLQKAVAMGFDYLATGHYATIDEDSRGFYLKKARDLRKDQSYFLYALTRSELARLLFPLGRYLKEEVRGLARAQGFFLADKGESQDICFLPTGGRAVLFAGTAGLTPGEIVDREGRVLGQHRGIAHYTIGQRTGLGIGGGIPKYVLAIDAANNRLVVGNRAQLKTRELLAGDCNCLVEAWPQTASAKIRYRKGAAPCTILPEGQRLRVVFREEQEAVTPGQAVVFYDQDLVLGGGVIEETSNGH